MRCVGVRGIRLLYYDKLTLTASHALCHTPCRFKMAEDIDSQMKRMAEDLKEIIEQINTANSNQDQDQSTVSGWGWWVGPTTTRTEWVGWVWLGPGASLYAL